MNELKKMACEFLAGIVSMFVSTITTLNIRVEVKIDEDQLFMVHLLYEGIDIPLHITNVENEKSTLMCDLRKMGFVNPVLNSVIALRHMLEGSYRQLDAFMIGQIKRSVMDIEIVARLMAIDPKGFKPCFADSFIISIMYENPTAKTFREALGAGLMFSKKFFDRNEYHSILWFESCYRKSSKGVRKQIMHISNEIKSTEAISLIARVFNTVYCYIDVNPTIEVIKSFRVANSSGILLEVLREFAGEDLDNKFLRKVLGKPLHSWGKYFAHYQRVVEDINFAISKYREACALPEELITESFILKQDDDHFISWSRSVNEMYGSKFCTSQGSYLDDPSVFRYCLADRGNPGVPTGIVIADNAGVRDIGYKEKNHITNVDKVIIEEINKKISSLGLKSQEFKYNLMDLANCQCYIIRDWDKFKSRQDVINYVEDYIRKED